MPRGALFDPPPFPWRPIRLSRPDRGTAHPSFRWDSFISQSSARAQSWAAVNRDVLHPGRGLSCQPQWFSTCYRKGPLACPQSIRAGAGTEMSALFLGGFTNMRNFVDWMEKVFADWLVKDAALFPSWKLQPRFFAYPFIGMVSSWIEKRLKKECLRVNSTH